MVLECGWEITLNGCPPYDSLDGAGENRKGEEEGVGSSLAST
jgi:hypothetical protein